MLDDVPSDETDFTLALRGTGSLVAVRIMVQKNSITNLVELFSWFCG